jgi:hypothetical protein
MPARLIAQVDEVFDALEGNVFLRGHVRRSLRCPLTVECDCSKRECCSVVLPQEPVVRSERLVQLAGLALISRYSASRGKRTVLQRSHAI